MKVQSHFWKLCPYFDIHGAKVLFVHQGQMVKPQTFATQIGKHEISAITVVY